MAAPRGCLTVGREGRRGGQARAVGQEVEGTNYTVCSCKVVDNIDQYYVSSSGHQQTHRQC